MHVLFVIGGLQPGGSERQMLQLMEQVHQTRCRVSLLTQSNAGAGPAEVARARQLGIDWVAMDPPPVPRALRPGIAVPRVMRVLARLRPDVAYTWLEQASAATIPAASALRVPVVVARRNISGAAIERWAPVRLAVRRLERTAPVVTANSTAVAEAARRRGIRTDRIRLVRNGHPPAEPLPEPPAEPVRLGYLAKFRAEKGHRRLLGALATLDRSSPWECVLGGDGPLLPAVRAEVTELGLQDRVTFAGPVTDPRAFWRSCHVGVLLSDHEGSPNALIEAAFAGRPLVATAVGGTPELVPAGAGILCAPDDLPGIATALQRLVEAPETRRELGHGAHQHASELYGLEPFVEGHLAALAEARR